MNKNLINQTEQQVASTVSIRREIERGIRIRIIIRYLDMGNGQSG